MAARRRSSHLDREADDRGQATLEVLGFGLMIGLTIVAIVAILAVLYTGVRAESTARLAARTASQGDSYSSAAGEAESHAPSWSDPRVSVSSGDLSSAGDEPAVSGTGAERSVSAKASLQVPLVSSFGLDLRITRYAVMPLTEGDR